MASTKYYNFYYLDWDSKEKRLIISENTPKSNSLIKLVLIETLSCPIILENFVPEQYYDINKKHKNYRGFKNYINNHMKTIKTDTKLEHVHKNKYTELVSEKINDQTILYWLNQNLYLIIEKEFYSYLIDTKLYVKYKSFNFYIILTYILTHSKYNQIAEDIKTFSETKFFALYLDTNYRFTRKNLSINYKKPSVGNIIIPYKYYGLEEERVYSPLYLKTIKPVLDSIKYTKYNKFNKLTRTIINLFFSSVNLLIVLIYIILAIIINHRTNIGFISYSFVNKEIQN
jgi:hypothetical protein